MYVTMINDLIADEIPAKMTTMSAIGINSIIKKNNSVPKPLVSSTHPDTTRTFGQFLCLMLLLIIFICIGKKFYDLAMAFIEQRRSERDDRIRRLNQVRRVLKRNISSLSSRVHYNNTIGSQDSVSIPIGFSLEDLTSQTSTQATFNSSGSTINESSFIAELIAERLKKKPKNPKNKKPQQEIWSEVFQTTYEPDSIQSESSKSSLEEEAANEMDDLSSPLSQRVSRFIVTPVIENDDFLFDVSDDSDSDSEAASVILKEMVQSDEKDCKSTESNFGDSFDAQKDQDAIGVSSNSEGKSVVRDEPFVTNQKVDGNKDEKLQPSLSIIVELEEEPKPNPVADEEEKGLTGIGDDEMMWW